MNMAPSGAESSQRESLFTKTRMCRFFLTGACSRGDQCAFAHGEAQLVAQPNLSKTKLCRVYAASGECADAQCAFAHGKHELRKLSVVRVRNDTRQRRPPNIVEPDGSGFTRHAAGGDVVQDEIKLINMLPCRSSESNGTSSAGLDGVLEDIGCFKQISAKFAGPASTGFVRPVAGGDVVQDDLGWMILLATANKEVPTRLCFSV